MTEYIDRPPKIFLWILRRLTVYEDLFAISRDHEIEYAGICQNHGRVRAFLWLLGNTVQAVIY